jgi:hypothetical protein
MSEENGREYYTTQQNEHVKQVVELDAQDRIFKIYTAGLQTPVGKKCELTIYGYNSPATTTVISRVETSALWTQAFQDQIDLLIVS